MDFITVTHPDLPEQPVRMAKPRNGWVPVEDSLATLTVEELRDRPETEGLPAKARKADLVAAVAASVDADLADPNDPAATPAAVDEPTAGTSKTLKKN